MDEAVGKTGSFINIPLPYALLMLALAIIAVVLIVLKVRSNKARAAMQAASVSGVVSSRSYEELSRSAYERPGSGRPAAPSSYTPYRAAQVNSPHERKGGAHAKRRNH